MSLKKLKSLERLNVGNNCLDFLVLEVSSSH